MMRDGRMQPDPSAKSATDLDTCTNGHLEDNLLACAQPAPFRLARTSVRDSCMSLTPYIGNAIATGSAQSVTHLLSRDKGLVVHAALLLRPVLHNSDKAPAQSQLCHLHASG